MSQNVCADRAALFLPAQHLEGGLLGDFRLFLITATWASIVGALLIPTFQRYFSRAVEHFQANRSLPRLLLHIFSRGGINYMRDGAQAPTRQKISKLASVAGVSMTVIASNIFAMVIWTVGVFASLYAGYWKPDLCVTCANLSSVINGFATVVLAVVIDPQVSVMTDDAIEGRISENSLRELSLLCRCACFGTLCAQINACAGRAYDRSRRRTNLEQGALSWDAAERLTAMLEPIRIRRCRHAFGAIRR